MWARKMDIVIYVINLNSTELFEKHAEKCQLELVRLAIKYCTGGYKGRVMGAHAPGGRGGTPFRSARGVPLGS